MMNILESLDESRRRGAACRAKDHAQTGWAQSISIVLPGAVRRLLPALPREFAVPGYRTRAALRVSQLEDFACGRGDLVDLGAQAGSISILARRVTACGWKLAAQRRGEGRAVAVPKTVHGKPGTSESVSSTIYYFGRSLVISCDGSSSRAASRTVHVY